MLTKTGVDIVYNDLSTELRDTLKKEIAKYGKQVRLRFNIGKKNPEYNFPGQMLMDEDSGVTQHTAAKVIYPAYWELSPVTFSIIDPGDKETKRIGLVKELSERGNPQGFLRCVLMDRDRGIKVLDLEQPADIDMFCLLLLHPALKAGMFHNKQSGDLFEIINVAKEAEARSRKRSLKADAMYVAANMIDGEIRDFACSMGWDEDEDFQVLSDRVSEMAEFDHENFNKFMNSVDFACRAVITRAEKAGVIVFVGLENKYTWPNGQLIAAFERNDSRDRLKALAEYLMGSPKGDEIYKRIKKLTRPAKKEEAEAAEA